MEYENLKHIFSQLPSLQRLVETHGNLSLFEYAQRYYHSVNTGTPLFESRKKECIALIGSYVTGDFSATLGEKVKNSLTKNYVVSTAEHHGPLGHSFFFQSALLRGLVNSDTDIINLCTSHVSLGNSSYPRGITFHGENSLTLHLPFFSAKDRMFPVFGLPNYTKENIAKYTHPKLISYLHNGTITENTYTRIVDFLNTFVLREDILSQKTYSAQITLLNHLWWSAIFPDAPDFIPLDAERIVSQILMEHLQKKTVLTEIMCNTVLQPRIEEYFDGISCCFDIKKKMGTYLFWHLDEHHNRHALWREGDELVSRNEKFRTNMTPEEISYHLEHNHLIPSGLLVYTTLSCYYGITCFGGFAQGNYLPKIQKSYTKILETVDIEDENLCLQSDILNEDMIFLIGKNQDFLTAMDIYKMGDFNIQFALESTKKRSIYESISSMLPEIARCL